MFSFHCCLFPLSSRRPVIFYGSICVATRAMAMLKPGLWRWFAEEGTSESSIPIVFTFTSMQVDVNRLSV